MMIVIPLLMLGAGVALILNTVFGGPAFEQNFPRPGAPAAQMRRQARLWQIGIGVFLVLAGVALLLGSSSSPA